ncbi:Fc.00g019830.m01.CDS01 [Cosmosporella sp. VM-42]
MLVAPINPEVGVIILGVVLQGDVLLKPPREVDTTILGHTTLEGTVLAVVVPSSIDLDTERAVGDSVLGVAVAGMMMNPIVRTGMVLVVGVVVPKPHSMVISFILGILKIFLSHLFALHDVDLAVALHIQVFSPNLRKFYTTAFSIADDNRDDLSIESIEMNEYMSPPPPAYLPQSEEPSTIRGHRPYPAGAAVSTWRRGRDTGASLTARYDTQLVLARDQREVSLVDSSLDLT